MSKFLRGEYWATQWVHILFFVATILSIVGVFALLLLLTWTSRYGHFFQSCRLTMYGGYGYTTYGQFSPGLYEE